MSSNTQVDIIEDAIRRHGELLDILLIDRATSRTSKELNIVWATDSYPGHGPKDRILAPDITGVNKKVIQPRIAKSKDEQRARTKDRAEVFTPKNVVYEMNQQVDWAGNNWPADRTNWKEYILENKLEITCGEAPFIVGRYNAINGKKVLSLSERVGFLDRKMQTVTKFTNTKDEWIEWAIKAYKASYGYEWQGDNLLLARENLLYTFIDYWNDRFPNDKINLDRKVSEDKLDILLEIATIISWNIFQMDGVKYVVPMSCKHEISIEEVPPMLAMLGEKPTVSKSECPGCKYNNPKLHNGKYAKIMDWEKNKVIKFVDLLKQ